MDEAPRKILDPVERLSEVLFGLIMALTFTASINLGSHGREDIRVLLYGALGCNLAWGIVDAVMYLLSTFSARGSSLRAAQVVRATKDAAAAHRAIAGELPPLVASLLRPSDYEHLRQGILSLRDVPERARLTLSDFRGAAGVFLLVFASTFPLVVPFLFVREPITALRLSHTVAVIMLFLVGYLLGRHSGGRPMRMGLAMVAIGLALVALTIALGG